MRGASARADTCRPGSVGVGVAMIYSRGPPRAAAETRAVRANERASFCLCLWLCLSLCLSLTLSLSPSLPLSLPPSLSLSLSLSRALARALALQTGIIEGRSWGRRSECALHAERERSARGARALYARSEGALCAVRVRSMRGASARADTCRRELPPRFRRCGCGDDLFAWAATSRR